VNDCQPNRYAALAGVSSLAAGAGSRTEFSDKLNRVYRKLAVLLCHFRAAHRFRSLSNTSSVKSAPYQPSAEALWLEHRAQDW
jgi:hypothetical protein